MATKKRRPQKVLTPVPARDVVLPLNWGIPVAAIAAGLVIVFWAYGPSLHGPFLFDDSIALPTGRESFFSWIHAARPLLMISYWLNARLSGTDTYPYHLLNVLFHCVAGGLIFVIVRRVLEWSGMEAARRTWLAGFAAAVFLLHPIQTEAVAYLAGRSDSLSVMLFMAAYAVFLYRKEAAISWAASAAVLLLFGAALLSKEHAIVLPALLLLTDFWWNPGFSIKGIRGNWRIYVLMAAGAVIGVGLLLPVILHANNAGFNLKDLTWYQYFFTQCRALFVYPWLFLVPANQSADWNFPMSKTIFDHGAIFGLIALLGLAGLAWWRRREYRLASFGFVVYLLLMAPTSSILPIRDAVAERRLYLSMVGLLLIAVDLLSRFKLTPRTLAVACAAIALVFAGVTRARAEVWSSELALWQDTVQKSPDNYRAHFQLASAYYNLGRCGEAVTEYEKAGALQTPAYDLLLDWGLAYDCLNQPENALAKMQQAAGLENTAHVHTQMGMIYGKHAQWAEALESLTTAEKIDPNFAPTYVYKGLVHFSQGLFETAINDYQRALAIDPNFQQARDGLAQAQARLIARH
jgi:MYXO-CTERM domain-containing protein